MQEKLDKLSAFCSDWCLDINIKKTKILVFNKEGKHLSHKFVFQNNNLECVSRYKYLDIYGLTTLAPSTLLKMNFIRKP